MCEILRQTSGSLEIPLCEDPDLTTENCPIAIAWLNPHSLEAAWDPIALGIYPPMGEID
jgi:hypothetical protein